MLGAGPAINGQAFGSVRPAAGKSQARDGIGEQPSVVLGAGLAIPGRA
jgi:hypothetical protein